MAAAAARFVVLEHQLPAGQERGLHWDLMLESEGVLRTWALEAVPLSAPRIEALALADHRRAYLDYEGPVRGDRGEVLRWDAGHYTLETEGPDELVCRLEGNRLRGRARLTRSAADPQRWIFSFESDSD